MIRVTGMDPDVHGCAFAYLTEWDDNTLSIKVRIVRQKEFKQRDAALALIRQDAFVDALYCPADDAYFPDVFVAEGQDVRYAGKTSYANPQDVCNLSLISGAAILAADTEYSYCPLPREWKGTVRKDIHQKRILRKLGIDFTMKGGQKPYPVPVNFKQYCSGGRVNAGDWQDLTDAVGLALWGLEKYKKDLKIKVAQ